ncbi:hypothetical protein EO98_08430 [Methanosarcina sp. 2.H.T.1A.6]|nr:hypothetical protein EO94_10285 [Methanosarcina sp. 2.H.T.1A.3]KKG20114.1 hypothetical protein EO98_08430 [Methanosarcina sp. 2.H.T.1A.6]KKG23532.1 hypothetical protein EO96_08490 [Methanosarcina sp. 2.H.T.1A.8]
MDIADIANINVKTQSIFCVLPDVCFPIVYPQTLAQFDTILNWFFEPFPSTDLLGKYYFTNKSSKLISEKIYYW